MIELKTTIYKCPYCKKYLLRKHAMKNHIKWCPKNPENITLCGDCLFLKAVDCYYGRYNNWIGDYEDTKSTKFHCIKLDIDLIPFKIIKMGWDLAFPETYGGQQLMKKECSNWTGHAVNLSKEDEELIDNFNN